MKKSYQKPGMYMEDFALSQSIALKCTGVERKNESSLGSPNMRDKGSCGWDMGNMSYWTSSLGAKCTIPIGADEKIGEGDNAVCYNSPNGGLNIFNYS